MKVSFFIDGFNLYHSLDGNPAYRKYKWLDLSKLSSLFVTSKASIVDIFYFTAFATWDADKVSRHRLYIKALEDKGIKTVLGAFRKKKKFCRLCKKWFVSSEEKRTDVNIAIKLFEEAINGSYEKAFIVSGDSDLIPAIEAIKKVFPTKEIVIVIPIARRAEELKQLADYHMKIKQKHLSQAQFPDSLKTKSGDILRRPPTWR